MEVINVTVRYEDGKWINGIGVYFFMLDDINSKLRKLIQDKYETVEEVEVLFFDIAVNLNRLIPMKRKKISYKDGILKLSSHFHFIENDYNELYNSHSQELIEINDVRNKFEHVPHIIKWTNYLGSNSFKKINFINEEYNTDIIEGNIDSVRLREKRKEKLRWEIDTDELVSIVIDINKIFVKIQDKLKDYFKNNIDALDHPYIKKIVNIDLTNCLK